MSHTNEEENQWGEAPGKGTLQRGQACTHGGTRPRSRGVHSGLR